MCALLDFESASRGPFAYDLAVTLMAWCYGERFDETLVSRLDDKARGVILLAVRSANLSVFEYSPRSVKSAVVGYGAAEKEQVAKMVRMLINGCAHQVMSTDASDALAIAICHAHTHATTVRLKIAR